MKEVDRYVAVVAAVVAGDDAVGPEGVWTAWVEQDQDQGVVDIADGGVLEAFGWLSSGELPEEEVLLLGCTAAGSGEEAGEASYPGLPWA